MKAALLLTVFDGKDLSSCLKADVHQSASVNNVVHRSGCRAHPSAISITTLRVAERQRPAQSCAPELHTVRSLAGR
jgi:hypothetical protein